MLRCSLRIPMFFLLCWLVVLASDSENAREAVVTYATNDVYALSAVVLGRTLVAVGQGGNGTEMIALVHSTVSEQARILLAQAGWKVQEVERIEPPHPSAQDALPTAMQDRDLTYEYGKLHAWRLRSARDGEPFSRVLVLDADGIVKQPIEELFSGRLFRGNLTSRMERSSKSRIFNGAILAFRADPSFPETLLSANRGKAHSGMALQGLLNEHFRDEWLAKPDNERIPQWAHYGAAACALPSSWATVASDVAGALILDFQGVSKPWRWPKTIKPELAQCGVLTGYAQVWAAILAIPPSAKPTTIRSMVEQVDKVPESGMPLLTMARDLAIAAMGGARNLKEDRRDDASERSAQERRRERARVRYVAQHLGWGVGEALLRAAEDAEAEEEAAAPSLSPEKSEL